MKNFNISKISIFLIFAAIVFAAGCFYYINKQTPPVNNVADIQEPGKTASGQNNSASTTPLATTTPSSTPVQPAVLNLKIPFTPQAPTGNWDELHNEACEEASAIMANAYLTGDTDVTMPAADVEAEISKLTSWQDQNFGYHLDTTAAETAKMIEDVYGLQTKVFNDYSFQDIKDQLNLHHVVILPVNGQLIGNPNYKQPGPIYHMLVVRGYTSTGLITNDSGTRRGENYPYTFSTLHNAGADWDHSINSIDQSKKVMIVVWGG